MKASDSARSEIAGYLQSPRGRRQSALAGAYVFAAVWLLAHLPYLAPSLEDIDSINFALGLHDFDPARHQPHPPGYPVFIAAGRLALGTLHLVASGLSYVRADALALAIWSALGGAVAIVAAAYLFLEMSDERRWDPTVPGGALLLAVTPLFWITGLRPMSDMCGLGAALTAQALLLVGARGRRSLVAGAILAGLSAGIRSQTVPLTLPLFAYALAARRRDGVWLAWPIAAFVGAALLWAVPLIGLTGGVSGYLAALGTQGAEDFAWVDMLWARPTPKAIAFALYDTFVLPYGSPAFGTVMLTLAVLGTLVLLLRDRRALLLLLLAFGPYAVFHLLFQETANLRYATPLVTPVVFLVAVLMSTIPRPGWWRQRRAGPAMLVLVLLASPLLITDVKAMTRYGADAHPAFRAIADMTEAAQQGRKPAAVFSHFALRRPLQAAPTTLPVVEPERNVEWLRLEDYWLKGGTEPVWFLADPGRTDLALIDPQARRRATSYQWLAASQPALMGTRPMAVDWYRFDQPPGWFAAQGWDLTPETAGIARMSGTYLQKGPITAYVRRRSEALQAIVAGRHLGPPTEGPSVFEVSLDGAVVDTWRIDPAQDGINFFRLVPLPQGTPAGAGNYAALTITARAEDAGKPTPQVAVEQFDVQPVGAVMFAFGDGWQEAEYDRVKGLSWRWTSETSALRLFGSGDLLVMLRGESPLKYFDRAPTVTASIGGRVIATYHPDRDFTWAFTVPAEAIRSGNAVLTITTDKVYLPGAVEGTADARRLGLRIYETRVETSR